MPRTASTDATAKSAAGGDWLMNGICVLAAVATFYGGFTVTVACGISPYVAWIWPVISDGLAYKAFRSVEQIQGKLSKAYAWLVTTIFAAQSGIAQGVDGVAGHEHGVVLPWQIRAAVNGMPAAAALAAGTLHWLTKRPAKTPKLATPVRPGSDVAAAGQDSTASWSPSSVRPPIDATTARPMVASAGRGYDSPLTPARPLSVVAPDTTDSRPKTGVSAATSSTARTVVSAVADTRPGHPAGHPAGQSEDTPAGQRTDSRTDTQDTPSSDSVRTPAEDTGQDSTDRYARVSAALLSGLSVRRAVGQLGESKSYVEKVSRNLAATRQNPPAKGSQ